jgi:hypothetical protein
MNARRVVGRWSRTLLATVLALVAAGPLASAAVADIPPFEITEFSARSLDAAGNDYTVAGGHPHDVAVSFSFPTDAEHSVEFVKSTFVDSPAGFVGNPSVTARCTVAQIETEGSPSCPAGSAVGVVQLNVLGSI